MTWGMFILICALSLSDDQFIVAIFSRPPARPGYALSLPRVPLAVMKRAAGPDPLLIHAYVLWAYGENGMGWNMGPRP